MNATIFSVLSDLFLAQKFRDGPKAYPEAVVQLEEFGGNCQPEAG